MASYTALRNLFNDSALLNRTAVAVIVAAEAISANFISETDARKAWAQHAFANPQQMAKKALMVVLAQNKDTPVANIQAAPDATLQTAVDGAINILSAGLVMGA